jgi:hypothetical protein
MLDCTQSDGNLNVGKLFFNPKESTMNPISFDEIQEGFQLLGLTTEEDRAKFTQFALISDEEQQEMTRLDFISQEDAHAELA